MNFDLDDGERALQQGMRDVCTRLFAMERVRALEAEPGGLDRKLWRELGDAGVFALRLPEPEGVGLGMTQAVLVFEELGRAIVPGPLVSAHLAARLIDGVMMSISSRPNMPSSPACGFKPLTNIFGLVIPSFLSAVSVTRITRSIRSGVISAIASRTLTCSVAWTMRLSSKQIIR